MSLYLNKDGKKMYTGNPRVTEKINQKIRLKITEIIKTCLENTLLMQNKTVKEEQ